MPDKADLVALYALRAKRCRGLNMKLRLALRHYRRLVEVLGSQAEELGHEADRLAGELDVANAKCHDALCRLELNVEEMLKVQKKLQAAGELLEQEKVTTDGLRRRIANLEELYERLRREREKDYAPMPPLLGVPDGWSPPFPAPDGDH